jgi:4-hydroxybenzoate polyprenyltransferase
MVRSYLQLIRLPNVLTAAADSLAGWLLVMGTLSEPRRWLPLVAASMGLYAAGTALNDVFDVAIDRLERPNRPIPSGQVSRPLAAWLGAVALAAGPLLASTSGSAASTVVAAILGLCILSYDAGLKHTAIGPFAMGACRGLNLLLGMTHVTALGGPIAWLVAFLYGLYVSGMTLVSRSETRGGLGRGLLIGWTLQNLAVLGLAGSALAHRYFPHPATDRPLIPLEGLLVFAVVAMVVNLGAARTIRQPTPGQIQKSVKSSILTLVWLNVGLVAAVRGPEMAALVALFWVPAFILGRWLYST